jgi:parvulin-like peptidyl-prolyl isomerase
MGIRLQMAALLLALALSSQLWAGEVLDRIVAIVNDTPVLLSDWDESLRVEALLAGRAPQSYSPEEQRAVFDRLVDRELLREQMRGYLAAPIAQDVLQDRLKEVKNQLVSNGDEKQWRALLSSDGLTEQQLIDRLRTQLEAERFVESRFRPGLRIDDHSVAKYYREEFLPKLRKAGQQEDVSLDEVADKIREILLQQRLDEDLSSWLQTLREQAEIRFPDPATGTKSPDTATVK